MDGTVRVWNLTNGQCAHTLIGHTSLVGLLGLSPSSLVSAAADSTLRIWDPETGELRHSLAGHTGAITCFQHDEFKVLSGSDGTLKMWDVRDGTQVRDLLTGVIGVWQVVFEGRWCVAASNRNDQTVLDVWDFGMNNDDDEWVGEPAGGLYDDSEDEDGSDAEYDDPPPHPRAKARVSSQAVLDAEMGSQLGRMEQDEDVVELAASEAEVDELADEDSGDDALPPPPRVRGAPREWGQDAMDAEEGDDQLPGPSTTVPTAVALPRKSRAGSSNLLRQLPANDETPTKPKTRMGGGTGRR